MFSELTTAGWIFVITMWGLVFSVTSFCIYKIIKQGDELNE